MDPFLSTLFSTYTGNTWIPFLSTMDPFSEHMIWKGVFIICWDLSRHLGSRNVDEFLPSMWGPQFDAQH